MLNDFKTTLSRNDKEALKEMLNRIDTQTETVLNARSINTARIQRVGIAQDSLLIDETGNTQTLS